MCYNTQLISNLSAQTMTYVSIYNADELNFCAL